MTVNELICLLNKIENKNSQVVANDMGNLQIVTSAREVESDWVNEFVLDQPVKVVELVYYKGS